MIGGERKKNTLYHVEINARGKPKIWQRGEVYVESVKQASVDELVCWNSQGCLYNKEAFFQRIDGVKKKNL